MGKMTDRLAVITPQAQRERDKVMTIDVHIMFIYYIHYTLTVYFPICIA